MITEGSSSTALLKGRRQSDDLIEPAVCDRETQNRTPWLLCGLVLVICLLPARSIPPGPLGGQGGPTRVLAAVAVVLTLLTFFLLRRGTPKSSINPGAVILLTVLSLRLLIWGLGVTSLSNFAIESSKYRAIPTLILTYGVGLYVVTRVRTARQQAWILGFLLAGLTYDCIVGLLQSVSPVDLQLLFQPPGFVLNEDVDGGRVVSKLFERFGALRGYGTSGHPIEFSVVAAITVPLAIHFSRFATTKRLRVMATGATLIALAAVPAGVSRSGLIALIVALFTYMWAFNLRQVASALLGGSIVFLAGFAAFPKIFEALWLTTINSGDDDSVRQRVEAYAKVSQTFHDHPVFGIGLGASPPATYGFLDNEWAQALVQGGIVGVTGTLLLTIGGFFGMAGSLRVAESTRDRNQAYAMGGMFTGILASSFTFDLFAYPQVTFLFFILFGLMWCRVRIRRSADVNIVV